MDDNWKDKNIYEKLLYVATELSKGGIKESGDASFDSERTGKKVTVKYVPRKEYLQRALILAGKVGLYWFENQDIEKNLLTTTFVNVNKPEEKLEFQNRMPLPKGMSTSKIMQDDGLIQSYGARRNEYKAFNIIESDGLEDLSEELNDDDDASQQKDLLAPITEKTKAELMQLLRRCDNNDDRVKSIASKNLLTMNEGWAQFQIKQLRKILEEQEEDVPYDDPKPVVIDVEKKPTPEQKAELRKLCKECREKGLCSDVINELNASISKLTYEQCEVTSRKMQEALNKQNQ